MKADYKNWVPKGMCIGLWTGEIASFILFIVFGILGIGVSEIAHKTLFWITLLLLIGLLCGAYYMQMMHNNK